MKISTAPRTLALATCLVTGAAGCATTPARPTPAPSESAALEPAQPVRAKEAAPEVKERSRAPGPRTISRAELNQVLDGAPGRFLQHVQTEPRFVRGHFAGWRLASFFPGDARFAGVDLRAGDVVLQVNGRSIEQPDQLMEVWEALRFDRALVVTVEREGQARTLRFDIRD